MDQTHPGGQTITHGHTYGEWAELWQKWAVGTLPTDRNPLFETAKTTADSSSASLVGQAANVWFLGGAFAASTAFRKVNVPAGTALFFPVVNAEEDTVIPGPATGDRQGKAVVKTG